MQTLYGPFSRLPEPALRSVRSFVDAQIPRIEQLCAAVERGGRSLGELHAVFSDGSFRVDAGAYLAPIDAFLWQPGAREWLAEQRRQAGPCLFVLPGVVNLTLPDGPVFGFVGIEFPVLLGRRAVA